MPSPSSLQPILDRIDDSQIKFDHQQDYDHFVHKLKTQLIGFAASACRQHHIPPGSPDAKQVEDLLVNVFMKYTLEFMRENLLVDGRPISPPPEFSSNPHLARTTNLPSHDHSQAHNGKDQRTLLTKPCDTALNERVIRQQYALYDAAVGNSRKRKDLPGHILNQVEHAATQARAHLEGESDSLVQMDAQRSSQLQGDPRQRWDVINAELPNIQRIQHDYTDTNKTLATLIESFPQLIENAVRAIDLHKDVASAFNSSY